MKNLLITAFLIIGVVYGALGQAASVTTDPASFTALDEVTFTFDVTGTPLADANESLYLWAWSDGVADFKTNGEWGNSSEASQLTPVEGSPNKYSFSFPVEVDGKTYSNIAEILGATPGQVKQIGTLIKTKVGNDAKKTDDLVIELDPLEFVEEMTRTFPSTVTEEDLVTIYFNQSLANSLGLKYQSGGFNIVLRAIDADGNPTGEEKSFEMRQDGEGQYSFIFSPTQTAFPEESDLSAVEYYFVSVANPEIVSDMYVVNFINQ